MYHRLNFIGQRNIGANELRGPAGLPDERDRLVPVVEVDVGHDHVGTLRGEGPRRRTTDASRRARDDCDLARERAIWRAHVCHVSSRHTVRSETGVAQWGSSTARWSSSPVPPKAWVGAMPNDVWRPAR